MGKGFLENVESALDGVYDYSEQEAQPVTADMWQQVYSELVEILREPSEEDPDKIRGALNLY